MDQVNQHEAFFPNRVDAAGLEVLLRAEVARGCEAGLHDEGSNDSARVGKAPLGGPGNQSEQPTLYQSLDEAERQASAGAALLELSRFWAPLRPLARGLLYLARTITTPQRRWNRIILEVIRSLADGLRHPTEDFEKAETERAEQALLLRSLNERVALLEAGVTERRRAQPGQD